MNTLIAECSRLNIHLAVTDGSLRVDAPKGALTPELAAKLKAEKPQIIDELQSEYWHRAAGTVTCRECANLHGDTCMAIGVNYTPLLYEPVMEWRRCDKYTARD